MRILSRNKQDVWFANRLSDSYVTDNNGLKTGEKMQTYGTPVKARMSVNASGSYDLELHGITSISDCNLITEDMTCSMDEQSIVWYGILPTHTETRETIVNGETVMEQVEVPNPHNYVVVKKVPSLNCIAYALKEVDVS